MPAFQPKNKIYICIDFTFYRKYVLLDEQLALIDAIGRACEDDVDAGV